MIITHLENIGTTMIGLKHLIKNITAQVNPEKLSAYSLRLRLLFLCILLEILSH